MNEYEWSLIGVIAQPPLITWIVGGIGFLVGLFLKEILASLREKRGNYQQSLRLFTNSLELNYLGEEISKLREEINLRVNEGRIIRADDVAIYKLCKSLQQLGATCLLGAVSTEQILMLNAPQIVRDWSLMREHVELELRKQKLTDTSLPPFQRRHAEWLSLITYMWMKEQAYNLNEIYRDSIKKFGELYGNDPEIILKKEKLIFQVDKSICSEQIRKRRAMIRKEYIRREIGILSFLFKD